MDAAIAPEVLETDRLVLRRARIPDAPVIFERYAQDPEVTKYLTWTPHETIERTLTFLQRCENAWQSGEAFPWVLLQKTDDQIVGMIELRPTGFRADIGYVLARPFWNRGYMTEAVRAVVDWALRQPGTYRVWAVCDVDNLGSARVLEKAGMQREGVLRRWLVHTNVSEEPRDCLCYSRVK